MILIIVLLLLVVIFTHKKNKSLKEIVFKYEDIITEQGKRNHEFNNQLMVLSAYLNNPKKLNEYLESIIGDYKTGQNYEIRQLSNMENGGIKQILYYKIDKMNKKNITLNPYIQAETKEYFNKLDTKLYKDISKIFSVFIDNAIDASNENDSINLDITSDNRYLYIRITNSISNKRINRNIGLKRYSTKGFNHGYGLLLVKDLVKTNTELEHITEYDNNYFSQTLLIDIREICRNF